MSKKNKGLAPKIPQEPIRHIINWNVNMPDEEFLGQIKEVSKRIQHNENGITQLETALRELAFADIIKTMNQELILPAFILCTCFIEQISTFRYGSTNIGAPEFYEFVKEYLPNYDGVSLRQDLRNRLVHNYSLGEKYILTSKNPQVHLRQMQSQKEPGLIKTLINLENMVEELRNALNLFCNQIKADPVIRGNALHALSQIFILGKGEFELNHTSGAYMEFPIEP